MLYAPYSNSVLDIIDGSYAPSVVNASNNATYGYWERTLFQRSTYAFKFNFPEEWLRGKDFILYSLFKRGFLMVAQDAKFGIFAQPVTVSGYDFYYQPVKAILANPAMNSSKEYTIGEECELLKLTPDYMGIWDIIAYHAERLSEIDKSINQALINTKFAWLVAGKNKAAAAALKKAYDKIQKGEPAVVIDELVTKGSIKEEDPFVFINFGDVKNNYIIDQLLRDRQTILNEFDAEIGIANVPYEKKERLVTAEAESSEEESQARVTIWKECLDSSMELINKMFPGLNLSVELRNKPSDNYVNEENEEEEVEEDAE